MKPRVASGSRIGESADAVAEIQGLYGAFTFPETLLQRIWAEGAFERSGLATADGRRIEIVQPGRWNRLGGPDFAGAKFRLDDGPVLVGDVELHLHAEDWDAHRHAADRAYDGVILHVVLFPVAAGFATRGSAGRRIPVLALLPWLHQDLEEYAADAAIERLTNRPASRAVEELGRLTKAELDRLLAEHAARRWARKVRFAELRVRRLGWESACHQTALEVLGYRANRAPMLRVAEAWPLGAWRDGGVDSAQVFSGETEWRLQGSRPANHPRTRLQQYGRWVAAVPRWPEVLAKLAADCPAIAPGSGTAAARRLARLRKWRDRLAAEVCGGALGGTRIDTLICDGFLPLWAAGGCAAAEGCWSYWFPGDLPPAVPRALRLLGAAGGPSGPLSHGLAQGLMGWMVETDAASLYSSGRGA